VIPYASKALEIMGRKTDAYNVVQSDDIQMFRSENLEQFDAVCFNNTFGLEFKDPELRRSLMDFINSGRGIIGIHAAIDSFYDWPEAAAMLGGYPDGHPWTKDGTWTVRVDSPTHPLNFAFDDKNFKINDEIYRIKEPYGRDKVRVLLSLDMNDETNRGAEGIRPTDKDVPVSWIRSYGRGRVFYCSLGRNKHIWWNRAVLRHYLAGIQFAFGDIWVDTTSGLMLFYGPDASEAISEKELQRIAAAVPKKATVAPKKTRKLLVFTFCPGQWRHSSIPLTVKALELMGEKTGAFEMTQSEDMSIFQPEKLRQFDAVYLCNTTHIERVFEPEHRKALIDFVKAGKGLMGNHSAADNFDGWPEAAEMIGGNMLIHPWTDGGTWAVKVEDTKHPLTVGFKEKRFKLNEQIFSVGGPYSRDKVRVLLSLDMSDEVTADVMPEVKDVPISWIHNYGKGRVFYTTLGHNHHIFWNEAILKHYLDGIQFILGDLPCDTTPSNLVP